MVTKEILTIILEQRCERNTPWDLAVMSIHGEIKEQLLDKPKTPEERVTVVKWVLDPNRWIALVDGWNMGNTGGFKDKKDAEVYRLGLIAQLKEKESQ